MAYPSLKSFIEILDKNQQLVRIKQFVDPVYEIAEITDRESKKPNGGKALLFENTGTRFPLLINAFGSDQRMCQALGVHDLNQIGERINRLFKSLMSPKHSIMDKLRLIPTLADFAKWMPKTQKGRGECQEIIHHTPDLTQLPILKCWPSDGGRFITLPMVITRDPDSGIRNVGMYRMQMFNKQLTGMHWHKHKVGARHFAGYRSKNLRMPVAVALGGDPAHTYAATAPLPDNIDEFMLSGFLRKERVRLVKAITQDIEVPADADFIIEGYIDPDEALVLEGPFGDHTGFYSLEDYFPSFHITCITHRKEAIYPATIVGIPPQEDAWLAKATEKVFLEPIRFSIAPELEDMHMPDEGVAHNLTFVKFQKSYAGQAHKIAQALWGAGQMMFNKVMVLTDKDLLPKSPQLFYQQLMNSFNPLTDLFFSSGPLDILDHSSHAQSFGGKLGIDITTKTKEEKLYTSPLKRIDIKGKTKDQSAKREYTILLDLENRDIPVRWITFSGSAETEMHEYILADPLLTSNRNKITIVLDKEIKTSNISHLVWLTLANIDPVRDCSLLQFEENKAILLVDATRKTKQKDNFLRPWPNYVASAPETIKKIDELWTELKLGPFQASPSLDILSWGLGTKAVVPN